MIGFDKYEAERIRGYKKRSANAVRQLRVDHIESQVNKKFDNEEDYIRHLSNLLKVSVELVIRKYENDSSKNNRN